MFVFCLFHMLGVEGDMLARTDAIISMSLPAVGRPTPAEVRRLGVNTTAIAHCRNGAPPREVDFAIDTGCPMRNGPAQNPDRGRAYESETALQFRFAPAPDVLLPGDNGLPD